MRPRDFISAAIVIAIVVAGIWWFTEPTASIQERTAQASLAAKGPLPITPLVEAPKLPPATPKGGVAEPVPVADVTPVADPRTKLDTAIAEEIRLYEEGDMVAFWEEFATPSAIKKLAANGKTIEQQAQVLQQDLDKDPNKAARIAQVVGVLRAAQGQAPAMSEDGNTAVYDAVVNGGKWKIIMEKQNGLWYLDDYKGGMIYDGPAN